MHISIVCFGHKRWPEEKSKPKLKCVTRMTIAAHKTHDIRRARLVGGSFQEGLEV